MTPFSIEGVVVGGVDYGDADRIVHLLTAERGRISAFARGAKGSRRRFGGGLDLFARVRAQLRARPGADLFSLLSLDVLDPHAGIALDLARIAHAGYACELARELSREGHENARLYARLLGFLGALAERGADADALCLLELGLMADAGLAPALSSCARCGAPVGEGAGFDPSAGGATCARDTPPDQRAAPGVLERLRALASGAGPGDARSRAMVRRFVLHQLGRTTLRSLRFLDEVA